MIRQEVAIRGAERAVYLAHAVRGLPAYVRLLPAVHRCLDPVRDKYRQLGFRGEDLLGKDKYLKTRAYLRRDIGRAIALGLHKSPPCRVLDIGCGPGYFLAVCGYYGHQAVGLDVPPTSGEDPAYLRMHQLYADMIQALGVERRFWKIRPLQPLPEFAEGPFDVVTANQASFHLEYVDSPWGSGEWQFFLDDLWGHVAAGCRLVMRLNPPRGADRVVSDEARTVFENAGASIRGPEVRIVRP